MLCLIWMPFIKKLKQTLVNYFHINLGKLLTIIFVTSKHVLYICPQLKKQHLIEKNIHFNKSTKLSSIISSLFSSVDILTFLQHGHYGN